MVVFKTEKTICDYLQNEKMIYPDLVKVSNMPENPPCPFPKGNYTVNNYEIDEKKFSSIPPGKYVARLRIFEDGKLLTQGEVGATVAV